MHSSISLSSEFILVGALLVTVASIVSAQCKDMFDVVPLPYNGLTRKNAWAYRSEDANNVREWAFNTLAAIFSTYVAVSVIFAVVSAFNNSVLGVDLRNLEKLIFWVKILLLALPLFISWRTTIVRSRIEERLVR